MPGYGRIPSPPDERDFKLKNFLEIGVVEATDPVEVLAQTAIDELKLTQTTYKRWASTDYKDVTVTHWWKALNALAQIVNPIQPPTEVIEWLNPREVLDQGAYGTCVGNGWAQWGNCDPINDDYKEDDARDIYYDATCYDGHCDNTYQRGATVRSGAKAMLKRARLSTYAQAATLDDALAWLQTKGTVVFGTWFTWDMESPDNNGLVHPTGGDAGGHCYIGVSYDPNTDKIKFLNSWGSNWGADGYFYMLRDEFQSLMDREGEAWVSVELGL